MTKFIGFIGAKGAGKSTAFDYLNAAFTNVNEIMIAKRLKKVCAGILSIPEEHFSDQDKKEQRFETPYKLTRNDLSFIRYTFGLFNADNIPMFEENLGVELYSPRHAAQYIGTQIIRKADPDAHLQAAKRLAKEDCVNIVTDIRFPNELDFFKKLDSDFVLVYIKRSSAEQIALQDGHESEKGLYGMIDQANILINNDGSFFMLNTQLEFLSVLIELRGGIYNGMH